PNGEPPAPNTARGPDGLLTPALFRAGGRTAPRPRWARLQQSERKSNMSHATTKNTNCLEGIRCPRCKQQELFYIRACVEVDVTDNGTGDERGEYFWDDQSPCRCADDTCD